MSADWVSAIGQIGGWLGTVAAVVLTIVIDHRWRKELKAQWRMQGRLLIVDKTIERTEPTSIVIRSDVRNFSADNIFDLKQVWHITVGGQRQERCNNIGQAPPKVFAPGGSVRWLNTTLENVAESVSLDMVELQMTFSFTDAAGRKWRRNDDGALELVA